MMFRALRRMVVSLCWDDDLLTPALCRYGELCPRGEPDRLEMTGDPAVRGSQVHVQVRLSRCADAAIPKRMEANQLDGLSPERPPYLGLLVPLCIVGKAVAFVQHVQGQLGGRARDQEGQRLFGIVSRLTRE